VIPAFVVGDPVDPGEQAGLETEASEAPERFEKHVLEDVLGLERIPNQGNDQGPKRVAIRTVQLPKSVRVAAPCG
jgi:hypothetical protein